MERTYVPISCSYYDRLEAWAVRHERVHIQYRQAGHADDLRLDGIITDLFSRDGAEYLKVNSGLVIRLDNIVSVNDIAVPPSGSCAV